MTKLETARKLDRQTAEQEQSTEKEKQEEPDIINQIAKILGIIMDSQRILNKKLHTLADGTKRRLAPLETWDKRIP